MQSIAAKIVEPSSIALSFPPFSLSLSLSLTFYLSPSFSLSRCFMERTLCWELRAERGGGYDEWNVHAAPPRPVLGAHPRVIDVGGVKSSRENEVGAKRRVRASRAWTFARSVCISRTCRRFYFRTGSKTGRGGLCIVRERVARGASRRNFRSIKYGREYAPRTQEFISKGMQMHLACRLRRVA